MLEKDIGIYIDIEMLGNFARNTAAMIMPSAKTSGKAMSAKYRRTLTSLRQKLTRTRSASPSSSGEWFADNFYIAERECRDAMEHISGIGRLNASGSGKATVSEAASALVRSGQGEVTAKRIELFLEEYQSVLPLREREMYIFVPCLKAELVRMLDDVYPANKTHEGSDSDTAAVLKNIFTSLRTLSEIDISDILEKVNRVEQTLMSDPAGVYPLMDEDTRSNYRRQLARIAGKEGISEYEAARTVLRFAEENGEHIGEYIYNRPLGKSLRHRSEGWYITANVLVTAFITVLLGILLSSALTAILLLIPVSEIVKNLIDFTVLRIVHPRKLPRLEFAGGVPHTGRTICVISALLTDERDGPRFAKLLEEYRLLNRDAGNELRFGILADLKESVNAKEKSDAIIIESAKQAVDALNKKYGGGFYLLLREREKSEADGCYMGRERKRGAITELVHLLSGDKSAVKVIAGSKDALSGTNFIITLDSDTRLTAGSAREMIGAAMHPLNVPLIDEKLGRVVRGYGILQPRVAVDLASAGRSDFTRVFAGEGGIDPYSSAVSDVYQDLFGEGTFMGKGIINVPVYKKLLDGVFPDNTVLSHDILEGAYLRCGFLSDTELTDGWPYKVTSYFSRQERWIRGDWQNLRWMTSNVRRRDGALIKNNLSDLSRWKIFDNLRRSTVPVMIFVSLAVGMLMQGAGFLTAAITALAAEISGLLLTSAELIIKHDGSSRARYQSAIISGISGAIMRTGIRLMLLPAEAWYSARAIFTALYRMTVSHKNMLSWVTSSDAERKYGNTMAVNYLKLLACPVAGILIMLLTNYPSAAALGLVWIFSPAYAWALSRETKQTKKVSALDKGFLHACASDIWRYFEDNLTAKDNYLPPDNVQIEPSIGAAHRTSPTNIGLAMMSACAACDLDITGWESTKELLRNMLKTVIKLEKWNGHLYNWYDTVTLKPLEPRYISTVDSGNLSGALITVAEMFRDRGEERLAEVCRTLSDTMDFLPLYDRKRNLFHIGWDIRKNEPSEGHYDLLASEARATSYIATALGIVPRKHWRRLGRALVSQDNYSGMVSWTGTMFEYLMPNLILPCYDASLIAESSRFCLYAQKRAHSGIPWGISESAFYAFDPGLSYQYKAHGVQRLALKRKMALDIVVSPYSSFLALALDTRGAVKNLRRLAALGAVGKYGFYDAVDFTPSRLMNGKCEIVRTFMAHHLGMSMVSIANTLCDNVFPKRFMSDVRMASYAELLQERVPTGCIVLRQPPRDIPEKPRRQQSTGYAVTVKGADAFSPRCLPLSNGEYEMLISENGKSRSRWRNIELTRFDSDVLGGNGIMFYIKTPSGIIPLQAAPEYREGIEYSSEFTDFYGRFYMKYGNVASAVTSYVPPSGAGEIRKVEVSIAGGAPEKCSIICAFEPVLADRAEYVSHPAFARLMLETEMSANTLIIHRRPRSPGKGTYMTVTCSNEMRCITEQARGNPPDVGEYKPTSPEMRVSIIVPIELRGGRGEVEFSIAAANDREECITAAKRMLTGRDTSAISRIAASALMLGIKPQNIRRAFERITDIEFSPKPSPAKAELAEHGYKKENLWKFGISGDIPLMATKITDSGQCDAAAQLVREHALLHENGVRCDLAIIVTDGGDYRSAQKAAITDVLRRTGREGTLGTQGGVFLVDGLDGDSAAVEALADVYYDLNETVPEKSYGRKPVLPRPYVRGCEGGSYKLLDDGTFHLTAADTLPEVAWSNILANESYGYVATEAGTGFMWYKNSRQMKINRWLCDTQTTVGTERLELVKDGEKISLFANGDGRKTEVTYGFGYAKWEKDLGDIKSRVTAFVPRETAARVLIIELEGNVGGEISYYTDLTLGDNNTISGCILTREQEGVISASNPTGDYADTVFAVAASEKPSAFTTSRDEWLSGIVDGRTGTGFHPCIGERFAASKTLVIVTGCAPIEEIKRLTVFDSALKSFEKTTKYWRNAVMPVEIRTPLTDIDSFINGWALYQTIACRLLARTSIYQNGGAIGFRDQLQDTCAITAYFPDITARQIKLCARHQYFEGDVQHWWHEGPHGDRGIRSRCSDDLLWLPYGLCDYVEKTGDRRICREMAAYLDSRPLDQKEHDRYESARISSKEETILQHAMRAADMFISRGTGEHGLALMLGGDWNDGMDAIGSGGQGESVWLSMFGAIVLEKLSNLCLREGETINAGRYASKARHLRTSCERAWTGKWYLRGYYDDAAPIGAPGSDECEIDSIAQSFSVFAGLDKGSAKAAALEAYDRLFDKSARIVKLFTPPFSDSDRYPGYIKAYAPGYRENGGQYTHGAVWLAMALLRSGERQRGVEMLAALAPHGRDMVRYKAEPYVIAADVYSAPGQEGRGGWTWYTGSAGWYYRAVTEELLGLHVRDGILYIEPKLPENFGVCHVMYNNAPEPLEIVISPREVTVNGKPYEKSGYPTIIHNNFISSAGNV